VFPGGCLPSLGEIARATARAGDFRTVHCEDFGPHYARTLHAWRARFEASLDDVRRLGYGEEFIRLWRYYLCYCEAAFEARYLGLVQMVLERPSCRREPYEIAQAAARPTCGATPVCEAAR
jgi:cyclopropane-fatty-acyl-phospholipid synthase